jgi:UDP-N-acetylmuramoyl-tripeptide--D-alanyl-D-alanine ligase
MYDYLRSHGELIFIQLDNPILREVLHGYDNIVTYGHSKTVQFQGHVVENNTGFLEVEITRPFHLHIKTQLTGDYNLDNVLSAVAVGSQFGVEPHDIQEAIEHYAPGNQRSQVVKKGNLTIVQDMYNANPSSMTAALQNFDKSFSGKKIIALGEMRELGASSGEEHEKIADLAAGLKDTILLLVGEHFKSPAVRIGCMYFEDSTACTEWLKGNLPSEGNLLIKGSRGSKMEKLMEAFTA